MVFGISYSKNNVGVIQHPVNHFSMYLRAKTGNTALLIFSHLGNFQKGRRQKRENQNRQFSTEHTNLYLGYLCQSLATCQTQNYHKFPDVSSTKGNILNFKIYE